jgi:hypothetical protein
MRIKIAAATLVLCFSSWASAQTTETTTQPTDDVFSKQCESMLNIILTELDPVLKKASKKFQDFTALQNATVFWQRYETLDCMEQNPEHMVKVVTFIADKHEVDLKIDPSFTPPRHVLCDALVASFEHAFTDGTNPDHGSLTPDASAMMNMGGSAIMSAIYSKMDCEEAQKEDRLTPVMLSIYQESKLKQEAKLKAEAERKSMGKNN